MTEPDVIRKEAERFRDDFGRLESEIAKRLVGQKQLVRDTLTALIAGGHVLLEGVPGLGKTLLIRTIANAVQGDFSRIQFTPDLIPADITGTEILSSTGGAARLEFQKGPVFTNLLLADEINRAAPKTQSALLEVMEESAVTVLGRRYPLTGLFFVMATQNPIEMEGTYPLPEAQLDRFFAKLTVPFPNREELAEILKRTVESEPAEVTHVLSVQRIAEMGKLARQVIAAPSLLDRISAFILSTQPDLPESPESIRRYLRCGAGPRGARALLLGAKIYALLDGRFNIAEEDIRAAAPMTLRHRLILNFEGRADGISADELINTALNRF